MISLHQLSSFIRIVELGSFAKASEDLFVSSPALIQQINLLESNIGFKLLSRTKKGVALTKSGQLFYTECRKLLNDFNHVVELGKELELAEAHKIHLGYTHWYPSVVASRFYSFFIKHSINYQIETSIRQSTSIVADIKQGNLDACIVWESSKAEEPDLKQIRLENHPLLLGIPKTNPLSDKDLIHYCDLNGQRIVVPPKGMFEMTDLFCERLNENNVSYETIVEPGNIESNIQCMEKNACRINSPVSIVEDNQLTYIPIDTDVHYCICLLYHIENEEKLRDLITIGKLYYQDFLDAINSSQA